MASGLLERPSPTMVPLPICMDRWTNLDPVGRGLPSAPSLQQEELQGHLSLILQALVYL